MKNFVPLPYRRIAVRRADFPLTDHSLQANLLGRDAYRRTDYVVLRRGDECGVAQITRARPDDLFSPITRVEFLAPPSVCHWADDPTVDVGNPSALGAKARAEGVTSAETLIVHGKYEHVNFIFRPDPIVIRVVDVVPPEPARIWSMAQQVLGFSEDLPAIELRLEPIDLIALARANPTHEYLFPCQASGIDVGAPVHFLDTRPAPRDWTMIGCERCAQFHRHFYGKMPQQQVTFCPRELVGRGGAQALTLLKCCLLETDVEYEGSLAIMPWGGNLKHVEQALAYLAACALAERAAAPDTSSAEQIPT